MRTGRGGQTDENNHRRYGRRRACCALGRLVRNRPGSHRTHDRAGTLATHARQRRLARERWATADTGLKPSPRWITRDAKPGAEFDAFRDWLAASFRRGPERMEHGRTFSTAHVCVHAGSATQSRARSQLSFSPHQDVVPWEPGAPKDLMGYPPFSGT